MEMLRLVWLGLRNGTASQGKTYLFDIAFKLYDYLFYIWIHVHRLRMANLICPGRRFHFVGPATLSAASPYVLSLVFGICSRYWFVDRPDCFICTSSHMYCGASPWTALYVISKNLKVIRCLTGNQRRRFKTGCMWSYFRVLVIKRAVQFCMRCSCETQTSGIPTSSELQ